MMAGNLPLGAFCNNKTVPGSRSMKHSLPRWTQQNQKLQATTLSKMAWVATAEGKDSKCNTNWRSSVAKVIWLVQKWKRTVRGRPSYNSRTQPIKRPKFPTITNINLDYHCLRLSSCEFPLKLDGQFVNHEILMNKCWHTLRPEATSEERLRNVITERVKRK